MSAIGDEVAMSAIGDLVFNLVARTQQFTSPIVQATRTVREFAGSAVTHLDQVADRAATIGTASGAAGGGLWLVAGAAQAIGVAVPGVSAVSTALLGVAAAAGLTSAGAASASGAISGIGARASLVQRVSDLLYRTSSVATLVSVGLTAISFVMSRFGRDTSRIDSMNRTLRQVALTAFGLRMGMLGVSLAARAVSAVINAPIRAAQATWRGLSRAVEGVSSALKGARQAAMSAVMSIGMIGGGGALGPLVAGLGVAGLSGVMGLVVGQSVAMASALETNTVAFTTMLGSVDAAKQHLTDLQQFAASTPFEFPELVNASRRLQALGFEADQAIPVMRIVGDAVGSLGLGAEGIDRITLALGQMRSKGKVSAQEINQLAEAGIPAWEMIAKRIGKTVPEAMKMAEKGAISAGTGINAVLEGMQGRFAGGMERQSQTLSGLWSTLKDSVGMVLTDIGQVIIEAFGFKGAIASTTDFVNRFRSEWMPSIASAIRFIASVFFGVIGFMRGIWDGWLGSAVGLLIEFVSNFDLYFQIALQNVVLFAANALNRFSNFFNNVGQLLVWFGENWFNIFTTAGNLAVTIFQNTAANLRGIWDSIVSYIAGNGFQFNPKPLADGFQSTISKLPNFMQAAIAETTPELEKLYAELGKRQVSAITAAAPAVAAATEAAFKPLNEELMDTEKKKKGKKAGDFAAALSKGSKEAVASIQRGQFGGPAKALETLGKQQLAESKKQTTALEALASASGSPVEDDPVVDFG